MRRLDTVLAEVWERVATRPGVRLVGIDGPSGSGKSVLAGRLAGLSGAPVIDIDDFVSWTDIGGWWSRLEEQVLTPLLSGGDAHYQVRDWANDEFGSSLNGWKMVPWSRLVVVEGVTCTTRGRGQAYLPDLGRGVR